MDESNIPIPQPMPNPEAGAESEIEVGGAAAVDSLPPQMPQEPQQGELDFEKQKAPSENKRLPRPKPVLIGVAAILAIAIVAFAALNLVCAHKEWSEPTCTDPKTCVKCGKAEGQPLGHDWQWEKDIDFSAAELVETEKCTVCDVVSDSRRSPANSFVSDGKFLFSPKDFFGMYQTRMSEDSLVLSDRSNSDLLGYMIYDDAGSSVGAVTFSFDGEMADPTYEKKGNADYFISVCVVGADSTSLLYAVDLLFALIDVCDPSLDSDDVQNVASKLVDNDGQVVKNGIGYSLEFDEDATWLYAQPV